MGTWVLGEDPGEEFSVLGPSTGGLQVPKRGGILSPASGPWEKGSLRQRQKAAGGAERDLPGLGVPGCDAGSSAAFPPSPVPREGGRGGRVPLAPTVHLAACYPCLPPPPPPLALPGHPPKIEKERKLFPQSAAARKSSPPVRGRAGFLELETNQSQARAAGPPPPARCLLCVSFP